jgi:hypothetical protein
MARQLRQVTTVLARYITNRFEQAFRWPAGASRIELPPIIELAFLRGEALLRTRFFSHFERLHFDDPNTLLHLWKQLRNNPEGLSLVVTQSGLLEAFKRQAGAAYIGKGTHESNCYTAYCCLLWDIQQQKDLHLLEMATGRLFSHFAATLFPSQGRRDDPKQLKLEIRKQLALRWHIRPEIRESFKTTDDRVEFTLLAKMSGYHPYRLLTVTGKRLKPTRLKACHLLLDNLESGVLQLESPTPRTSKKDQPLTPV